jgi:hypothetical protein
MKDNFTEVENFRNIKIFEKTFINEAKWDNKLNSLVTNKIENLQLRLQNPIIDEDFVGNAEFKEKLDLYLTAEIDQVSNEKFQCRICNKVFH